ncbi:hypothetical protein RB195_008541 [Necator americanus]|uniref:Peptidase M41 FtsH extracellular domain-containing protein n=1 Tax=Necator americanus TaxID=51031 RepID=A0ABR1CP74_NECAM
MEFNSKRICRKLFVIVVILCALFLVKFELLNGSGHSHLSTEEFFKLINAEYGPARILEKFQMEDGTFLYIVDMIGLVNKK